ncbi:MAG: cell division protein ZipA C-terminal FtsZ-binding domain-containing protein [Gammaproteobacteria bacterium]|nr:cell division protein ZipA C-terminal FtsZ-binding domain-containing protein [Gammaproteobacteria bacterium]MDH5734936.1 cell division protein ZipA C-terminal FtsZ-binding domain-containing protein [Gammaproteobacteria bacterium]
MDELRWILLGLGVVLIVAVYFWGRYQKSTVVPLNDKLYEAPSFSAKEDDNRWVDGVGPVRVVIKDDPADVTVDINVDTDTVSSDIEVADDASSDTEITSSDSQVVESTRPVEKPHVDDVVSVYLVVAKDKVIKGEHIYSACLGNNLQYGEMKIFHRIDDDGEIVFSLSDMMKPGWFDIDHMNHHETRGISLFAQLSLVVDPVRALDDMLLCAYGVANLLGAQLCGNDRMLLNESTVKLMREKAKRFKDKHQSVEA